MNETKSVFISIVGKPNVGKSSILNKILGQKVAIVSKKPQTTRTRIMGVLTEGEIQRVFIDTPGFHNPKTKLSEHMVKAVKDSLSDVDVIMFVVDATSKFTENEERLIASFKAGKIPVIMVLNKIDLIEDKSRLLSLIAKFTSLYPFAECIPVSAVSGEGLDELLMALDNYAILGPHFFPPETLTDQPETVLVSEIVREKILRYLYDELPHGTAVVVDQMEERGKITDIDVTIYTEKKSHKGMIIGKGGEMLKRILTDARRDIERLLGCKVNLKAWVKVKEDWRNKEGVLKTLGLK